MAVTVVDIGVSNIASVVNALRYVGTDVLVTRDPEVVSNADKLVLPGVGAFNAGYDALEKNQLAEPIRRHAGVEQKPLLGICLGMQMLATVSEEDGEFAGLDLIPGRVTSLVADMPGYRVPNIGWCNISANNTNTLIPEAVKNLSFYHVHSYYFKPESPQVVVATIEFSGRDVPVMVQHNNIFGVQFHPEKSQDNGLDLLNQFNQL